ncbi:MAG: HD-GYP domain-containing protein, partial [Lachnospiraceae bacterium]|nr:HD-GYP domain-containing protein [Lachnospiraceae bacterium]
MISGNGLEYAFYSVADGLCSVPTGRSHSYLDDNGDLYICGRRGVSCVNIEDFFVQTNDLILSVPYIEADGVRYYHDEDNTFRIPSTAEYITVYAFALTYTMHDPMIEYMLEGSDKQPVVLNKSDMMPVRYTNLRGGEHEFSLSVLNSSTRNVRQTAIFRIVKQRRFYEHWWFYLLCLIAVVVFVAELIRLITRRKMQALMKRAEEQKRLFDQTATALVNAIDAKDKYTHGHSSRVADYARKIAELAGKDEDYCDEIYYAALLHDVGKIGIPESIINKTGRLTDEEYEIIKQHPEKGVQILESISEIPNLSIGAHYHHERYDGKGYPSHMKGTDIPEIARIISVADAYDAMTSNRSYRSPIPQQKVREEIVKGSGTQFDPDFARTMLHLIDVDTEYDMQERAEIKELSGKSEMIVKEHRSAVSEGILVSRSITTIRMKVTPAEDSLFDKPEPSMILFDSLDGRVHDEEKEIKDLVYLEYGEINLDGRYVLANARKMQMKESEPDN